MLLYWLVSLYCLDSSSSSSSSSSSRGGGSSGGGGGGGGGVVGVSVGVCGGGGGHRVGVVVAAEEVHVTIATSASQSNVIESSTNVRYANYQSLSDD